MLPSQDSSRMDQDSYMRNSRSIGVLWSILTVLLAIIAVVVFTQPFWIGDGVHTPRAGHFGLYHVCVGRGTSRGPEGEAPCQGSFFSEFSSIPSGSFQAAAILVLASVLLVLGCIGCFGLFFFCNTAMVYKTCAWTQLLCAVCLVLGCVIFPNGWDAEVIRDMCGEETGRYALGHCSVRWAYILAGVGVLDALVLSFLAFVLGNRQSDFLQEERKVHSRDFPASRMEIRDPRFLNQRFH